MKLVLLFLALSFSAATASADPLSGEKTVYLVTNSDERLAVATVSFQQTERGENYVLDWHTDLFGEYFLSMRPFKCLEGPGKNWCYVPYPYENHHRVSADDLTDLEYDLLFLWKKANDYGITLWNGVYYKLEVDGDRIIGAMHDMDMNRLSAPPPEGDLRPVRESDLYEAEKDGHWLPFVIIE